MIGMDLRRRMDYATVDPLLPHRWPRSVKGGKGRVIDLCAAALLGVGFGA